MYTLTLRNSHTLLIDGDLVVRGGYFVDGAVEIVHTKHEHRAVAGVGKFKIVAGERAGSPSWLDAMLGD